jgi:tripartite-type tricarboxylate transporter receptor subunit TctC
LIEELPAGHAEIPIHFSGSPGAIGRRAFQASIFDSGSRWAHCCPRFHRWAARLGGSDMKLPRRKFLYLAAGAAALPAMSRIGWAQAYPARPVQLIVTFPAGSAPDIIARLAGQNLSERFGQQFVIENKPGAGGNIATEYVAKAEPDGYTILMPVSTNAVNVALYRNLNFDFIRDIAPIAGIAKTPFVIVVPASFPAKTLSEFIAYLKANPGTVNMASAGIGTSPHVCGELFQLMTGTRMVHVPYRGNYMSDLLAGQVQIVFNPIAQALPLIREGKLRALGVTTAKRTPALPDVPAIGEFVKGYDAFGWYGLGAPARTPPDIIKKLSDAMNEALANPMVRERFSQLGVEPMPLTPDGFAKHIAEEADKWAQVIKAQGIKMY